MLICCCERPQQDITSETGSWVWKSCSLRIQACTQASGYSPRRNLTDCFTRQRSLHSTPHHNPSHEHAFLSQDDAHPGHVLDKEVDHSMVEMPVVDHIRPCYSAHNGNTRCRGRIACQPGRASQSGTCSKVENVARCTLSQLHARYPHTSFAEKMLDGA